MVWPLSSSTEKVVLGKTWRTLPNTSSGASLVSVMVLAFDTRGLTLWFRLRRGIVNLPCTKLTATAPLERPATDLRLDGKCLSRCRLHEAVLGTL